MAQLSERSDEERRQQQVQEGLWARLQQGSRALIYSAVMRAGGEPFGAPYELGLPTLTERVVKKFRQRGFFGFESSERLRARNKYTRYGAAPYRGAHAPPAAGRGGAGGGVLVRLLALLRGGGRRGAG